MMLSYNAEKYIVIEFSTIKYGASSMCVDNCTSKWDASGIWTSFFCNTLMHRESHVLRLHP